MKSRTLNMVKYGCLLFSCTLFIFGFISCSAINESSEEYIVYMGSTPKGQYSHSLHHLSMLQEVVGQRGPGNSLTRSYRKSFNGFAAQLTPSERQKIASIKGVVSVFPSTALQLHTTRSWDFMEMSETVNRKQSVESDIIIGVIDSGIWPENESFNDKGYGPPPKKWKGVCNGGSNFTCNNKIIGARYYSSKGPATSARDEMGHGSHTASTAAGSVVRDASFIGLAKGTARGGVPSARIAAYRVCYPGQGCNSADVLAAFDDAIADGVDIITISLGGGPTDWARDPVAIGAFHAMEKGILTVQSAGNSGCGWGTVGSTAPWLLTVGASSIDRTFVGKAVLGNGESLEGLSVNSFDMNGTMYPIVYGKGISKQCDELSAQLCSPGCVEPEMVKGKIVLCERFTGLTETYLAGAAGAIVATYDIANVSFVMQLPATTLDFPLLSQIIKYINETKDPKATILRSESAKDKNAPTVASFSSCGPNKLVPEIIKPDVTAPGVDILAAYSPIASPTSDTDMDRRQVNYNVISGTSMSCPHVAGVAAYVKSFHPDWSPSAIKSAIMTTAWQMNTTVNKLRDLEYGSGHVSPVKAIDPGLVYELGKEDYIKLLCSLGFDAPSVARISGDNTTCREEYNKLLPIDFNYPAITARVMPMVAFSFKFNRTVTNVGNANSTYNAIVTASPNITVSVEPQVLSFNSIYEKKSFVVSVTGSGLPDMVMMAKPSSVVWSDGTHSVRSPVVLIPLNPNSE